MRKIDEGGLALNQKNYRTMSQDTFSFYQSQINGGHTE